MKILYLEDVERVIIMVASTNMAGPIIMGILMLVFYLGLAALSFYILYRVVRAAVRDGIKDAKKPTDTEKN